MYIGTLTLSLLLAVFGAVLLAVLFGNHLAQPLLLLAQGVRDVARGDLTPKAVSLTRDEVGGLTRSFALMTQRLLEARTAVNQGVQEVQAARTNLQTILDNLTAGCCARCPMAGGARQPRRGPYFAQRCRRPEWPDLGQPAHAGQLGRHGGCPVCLSF